MRFLALAVLSMCLPSSALACGGQVVVKVVGWSPAGHAVVRTQHDAGNDELHALELDLIGPGKERHWDILTEEDNQDPKIRGARWKKAEAELLALGIVFEPDLQSTNIPFTLSDGTVVNEHTILSGQVDPNDPDDGESQRHLVAQKDGNTTFLAQVPTEPTHYRDISTSAVWHHPITDNIVITEAGFSGAHRVLDGESARQAAHAPRTSCHGTSNWRVVGWGPTGAPVVRVEELGHVTGGSQLCALSLQLLEPEVSSFVVVRPQDLRPDDSRRSRWPGVETALKQKGVVLASKPIEAIGSVDGKGVLRTFAVPGRPYTLELVVDPPAQAGGQATLHVQSRFPGRITPKRMQLATLKKSPSLPIHQVYWSPSFDVLVLLPARWQDAKRVTVASLDELWDFKTGR